jgi:hypothetical protein
MSFNNFSRLVLLVVIGFLLQPELGYGQMFSVNEDRRQRQVPTNRAYVGLEPVEFNYFGPRTPQQPPRYEMNNPILRLRYESRNTEFFMGYGDALTGADSVNFFQIGGSLSRPIRLFNSRKFRVQFPIKLQADLTTASNKQSYREEFQQSGIMIGAGPELYWRISSNLHWQGQVIPQIGYSLSPGGTFGGSISYLGGGTRFIIDHVFGKIGLSFGYDYTYKRFNIDVDRFDYKFRSHAFLIGITF